MELLADVKEKSLRKKNNEKNLRLKLQLKKVLKVSRLKFFKHF